MPSHYCSIGCPYIYIYRGSREETCNNESGVIWRDVKVVDRSFGPTSATKRRA